VSTSLIFAAVASGDVIRFGPKHDSDSSRSQLQRGGEREPLTLHLAIVGFTFLFSFPSELGPKRKRVGFALLLSFPLKLSPKGKGMEQSRNWFGGKLRGSTKSLSFECLKKEKETREKKENKGTPLLLCEILPPCTNLLKDCTKKNFAVQTCAWSDPS